MARDPVLVFGASGTHGGAVAQQLLSAGVPVSAFVRDPGSQRSQALASRGAKLILGDFGDVSSIERALAAVPVAYAVTTPFEGGAVAEVKQGEAIITAATRRELPWLIFASVAAATRAPVPHFKSKALIEEKLRAATVPWTILAPSYFYENILGSAEAIRNGVLPMALPADTPLDQVALRDLGSLVALVLGRREEHLSQRIEVASYAPTPREMAKALGARAEQTPIDDVRDRSPDLAAMYEFLAEEGYGIDTTALRDRYPEIAWISFAEWASHTEMPDR
jgi:uncharacterized protein YbjT (DUF2867 family)